MDRQTERKTEGWRDGEGRMRGWMDVWMDSLGERGNVSRLMRIDGQTDSHGDEWMDGSYRAWTDGQTSTGREET